MCEIDRGKMYLLVSPIDARTRMRVAYARRYKLRWYSTCRQSDSGRSRFARDFTPDWYCLFPILEHSQNTQLPAELATCKGSARKVH